MNQPSYPNEPIAIIGMGCRFPGAANPAQFWELLRSGVDIVRPIPTARWDVDAYYDPDPNAAGKLYVRQGYFLDDIDHADAHFFNLNPKEAAAIDPQQRLLLEVSWETLEDANIVPATLAGSQTGIFLSTFWDDYSAARLYACDPQAIDRYAVLSNQRSMIGGRLAHLLGVHGPNVLIDTACSASLTAIHLACQSLRSGECDLALAGGVYLWLTPELTIGLCRMGAIAADGRSKPFDQHADGFGQGEGCGMVLLKRLSAAQAAGDTILALIRGSAINHDGQSRTVTTPNGAAQQALVRQTIRQAGVDPHQVAYVEANGTGTTLGDPVEILALAKVLCSERKAPLLIGSVKSNIGHLNAAAGVAGLLKVVLALQHEELPPTLHISQLNPHIPWQKLAIDVPTRRTPWPASGAPRIAGISSFGMSGSNAHLILEEAPACAAAKHADGPYERSHHLLTLSAKTPAALHAQAQRYAAYLQETDTNRMNELGLADLCYTANTGRQHFDQRLTIVATSWADAHQQLASYKTDNAPQADGVRQARRIPKVAFLFSGHSAPFTEMGRELYETQPTLRRTLDQCDEILRPLLGQSILPVLYPDKGTAHADEQSKIQNLKSKIDEPACFALSYALATLWQSWGVQPDGCIGQGSGEVVAACVAGVFGLEDGLQLAAALAQTDHVSGVEAPLETVQQIASRITYHKPQRRLISPITGKPADDEILTPAYWLRAVHEPGHFAEGVQTLCEQGIRIFLEISPVSMVASAEPMQDKVTRRQGDKVTEVSLISSLLQNRASLFLPSLGRERGDWPQMLTSLGVLYQQGIAVDWAGFDRDYRRRKVALPTYPFQRQRYWLDVSPKTQNTTATDQPQQPLMTQAAVLPAAQPPVAQAAPPKEPGLRQTLNVLSDRDRQERLVAYLCDEVAVLLGDGASALLDEQTQFFALGLDSRMAVALRNRLQEDLALPLIATILFDYPTPEKLSTHLIQQLFPVNGNGWENHIVSSGKGAAQTNRVAKAGARQPNHHPNIDELSAGEIGSLLDQELAALAIYWQEEGVN